MGIVDYFARAFLWQPTKEHVSSLRVGDGVSWQFGLVVTVRCARMSDLAQAELSLSNSNHPTTPGAEAPTRRRQ